MKQVYQLIVQERNDYFFYHDTLVCKILNIDENSKRVTETVTIIDGVEIKRTTKLEYLCNGEYRNLASDWQSEYFETLDKVKEYIESEYELVKSDKSNFYFLVKDDGCNSVVTITNYTSQRLGCANDFVNLQNLIGLEYDEPKDSQ